MTINQNDIGNVAPDGDKNSKTSSNPFVRLIQYHYRGTGYQRSDAQIKNEETLFPCVPFNRWFSLPAAIIVQFCCGSLYSWSVFNKPIDILIYGENHNIAPITFYITVGFFGFSAALMGPWLERNGPKKACLIGTTLLFMGNLITALALYLKLMWLVFIGYGIVAGFGYGLCYISPISAIQKWFPDRRGLASGFATCGFGAGSIVIAKIQLPLIDYVGLPLTFVVLGCSFFILMSLAAMVLRIPPPNFTIDGITTTTTTTTNPLPNDISNENNSNNKIVDHQDKCVIEFIPPQKTLTLIESITSKEFRLMYIMLFSNAIFGLVVISRFSNMITDIFHKTSEEASTAVSINGGFNLGGRLIFSIFSDYVGRKICFIIMLVSQLIILGSFSTITTTQTYWAFLMTMWILTACYGAGFGVIPAFLTDIFGPSNIGACHGIILTAWAIAGVGGGLIFTAIFGSIINSGYLPTDPYPYNVNVWWIFCVVLIGCILLIFVQPTVRDQQTIRKLKRIFCCCCRKTQHRHEINNVNGTEMH